MNNVNEGREKLKRALLEVSAREIGMQELAMGEEVCFSPRLTKKMNRLLKNRGKRCLAPINTAAKRAVTACLAIVFMACALMSCKPIRDAVVDFFQNVYEAYTELFFCENISSSAPEEIEEVHMPEYIPEGYELAKTTKDDFSVENVWENGDDFIKLYQYVLGSKTTLDTETSEIEMLEDIKIAIVTKENEIIAFWNTDEYAYRIKTIDLSKEEILNIIRSIKY